MNGSTVITGLTVGVSVLYPLIVFIGPLYLSIQSVALILFVLLSLRLVFNVRNRRDLVVSLVALMPIAFAATFDSEIALRMLPVIINIGMLMIFWSSLNSIPIIERFARTFDPDLSQARMAHCRQFTTMWCAFFAVNAAVAFALCWAEVGIWAFYTGPLNYAMMGAMFACEFLVRRCRFAEYSERFYDRMLGRILHQRERNVAPD